MDDTAATGVGIATDTSTELLPNAADQTSNKKTLAEHIQSLAQELQDNILDYTLAIPPGTVHVTGRSPRFPWQLTLNRRSRNAFAKHYYSTRAFEIDGLDIFNVMRDFLCTIPVKHRGYVRTLRHRMMFVPRFPGPNPSIYGAAARMSGYPMGSLQGVRGLSGELRVEVNAPTWDEEGKRGEDVWMVQEELLEAYDKAHGVIP